MTIDERGIDMPMVCMHCEDPPCKYVCPTSAIDRDPKTNGVIIKREICIGCRACIFACPFGAISFDPEDRQVIKCDLCGGDPACVRFCSTEAIQFLTADEIDLAMKTDAMRSMSESFAKKALFTRA